MGTETRIDIQPMSLRDLPEILSIEHQCFTTPWSYSAFLSELIDNDNAYYLIARLGPEIIGYIGMWVILDEGHITNVAVATKHRGQGVGKLLIDSMTELAMEHGVTKLTLEVRVSNKSAQGLYRKLGFVDSGIRPGYYRDNNEDALIMWKDLTDDEQERTNTWD